MSSRTQKLTPCTIQNFLMVRGVTVDASDDLVARYDAVINLQVLQYAEYAFVDTWELHALKMTYLAGVEVIFVALEHFPHPAVVVCGNIELLISHGAVLEHCEWEIGKINLKKMVYYTTKGKN